MRLNSFQFTGKEGAEKGDETISHASEKSPISLKR